MKHLSDEIARELSEVAAQAMRERMEHNAIVSVYDRLQAKLMPRLGGDDALETELRRRVAEWKFYLLSTRDCPENELRELYRQIEELGYSTLEKEATIGICYAQFCLKVRTPADAETKLREAKARLDSAAEAAIDSNASSYYRDLARTVAQWLARLEQADRGAAS